MRLRNLALSAAALLLLAPVAAYATDGWAIGQSCPTNGATAGPNLSGQSVICTGGLWVLTGGLWGVNGTSYYYNTGNVGIGTTAPRSTFDVYPDGAVYMGNTGSQSYINVGGSRAYFGYDPTASDAIVQGGAGHGIRFFVGNSSFTSGTMAMKIDTVGNVGVGSTSPIVSLDLSQKTDAIALPAGTYATRPTNVANGEIRYNSSIPGLEAYMNGSWTNLLTAVGTNSVTGSGTANYVARWTPNGTTLGTGTLYDNGTQVGVGTTSLSDTLDIAGNIGMMGYNYGYNIHAGNVGSQFNIDFPDISTNSGYVRAFRNTNTTSTVAYQIFKGDGSANANVQLAGNTNSWLNAYTGNVGIGTTSPADLLTISTPTTTGKVDVLDVTGNIGTGGNNYPRLRIDNTNAGSYKSALGFGNGGASPKWEVGVDVSGGATQNFFIYDNVAALNRFYIDNNGNVGIGTTSPSNLLQVNGTASANSLALGTTDITAGGVLGAGTKFNISATDGNTIWAATNGSNARRFGLNINAAGGFTFFDGTSGAGSSWTAGITQLAGNVGIATTSPTSLLTTYDSAAKTATYTGVLHDVFDTSTTASVNKIGMDIESTGTWTGSSAINTGLVVNATGGTTNYAATFNGGNVGIGTTSPFYFVDALQNNGGGSAVNRIYNTASGASTNAQFIAATGTSNAFSQFNEVDNAGSPYFQLKSGSANSAAYYDMPQHIFRNVAGTEWMRINSSGNVGIGTTSPLYPLHATGSGEIAEFGSAGTGASQYIGVGADASSNTAGRALFGYDAGNNNALVQGAAGKGIEFNVNSSSAGSGVAMTIGTTGNVGIGTTGPLATLDVSGSMYARAVSIGTTTVNWATGNVQGTSQSCGAFSFSGMQDGGSYSLTVEGTTLGTCSFSNSDSPTLTFKMPANHGSTTAGTMTLYHFTRRGTNVFVTWMPGY